MPVNALLSLLQDLKNTRYNRLHLCTVGQFNRAQRRMQNDFPLALNLIEGDGLWVYLNEAKERFRDDLAHRRNPHAADSQMSAKTLWTKISQWWRNRLTKARTATLR